MSESPDLPEKPPSDSPVGDDRRAGYLGFVAHEVRNPLSTALWSAELLVRMAAEERGGARGEKLTAMCLRSLGRVRQLIEDHFLCERLDAGGLSVRPELVSVRDVLDEVSGRRPPDASPLELDLDRSLVTTADRPLLERLLDALVAASGRDGDERDSLRLAFAGAPPAPEALADPRKGSPGDQKGRALALPLARRVAVALGGTVAVDGGEFAVTLPRAAEYTARPDPAAHP